MGMDFYKKEAVDGERSPWVGAGIGAGGGGLLAAALGYIYGHRGKWLAYDTLTGGLAGGAAGYAIEQSNKNRIDENNSDTEGKPEYDYVPKDMSIHERSRLDRQLISDNKKRMEGLEKYGKWYHKLLAGYLGQTAHPGSRSAEYTRNEIASLVEHGWSPEAARKWVEWFPGYAIVRAIKAVPDTANGPKVADPIGNMDREMAGAGKIFKDGLWRTMDWSDLDKVKNGRRPDTGKIEKAVEKAKQNLQARGESNITPRQKLVQDYLEAQKNK